MNNNDEFISYLARLKYMIVPQETDAYQVICKDGQPLGFLFSNGEISLTNSRSEEAGLLEEIRRFVERYKDFSPIGDSEYLVGHYGPGKLAARFNLEKKRAELVVTNGDGVSTFFPESDERQAVLTFCDAAGLWQLLSGQSWKEKWNARKRARLLRKLNRMEQQRKGV